MASLVTVKPVNLHQLSVELGVGIISRVSAGQPLELEADVDLVRFQTVLAAHVADPFFGDTAEDRTLRLARVQAQAVIDGLGTYTALESQRLLAHLVLKTTRT